MTWMWKVEDPEISEAEIRLNALSSKGWEITQTHVSDAGPRELVRLIIVAKKPMPEPYRENREPGDEP